MTLAFCKRCLYAATHPLGLVLDVEGICSGCRIHEEKDSLDWSVRWQRLVDLVGPYRDGSGQQYDCIVPVTGAADSYFIVHVVKERLGLHPLLVTYNRYFNTPLGIRNLANLRIRFNCDILVQNVNPITVRNLTRSSLRQFGSVYWPVLAGQTVFPVQTAVRYGVPLIIWGAHQGVEQVGMFSHEHEVEMTRRHRKDHDLMGREADDLLTAFDTLGGKDIWQYRYPDDHTLQNAGVRGIYLGNFIRWDPKAQHEQMMGDYGYESAPFARTFDCYDHTDCFAYMGVHDVLKLHKHGYSKVTDHACREIRFGRITRDQGLALVRAYEQQADPHFGLLADWLGTPARSLQFLLDQHRNPAWWKQLRPGHWAFRGWSERQPKVDATPTAPLFTANSSLERGSTARYITIGKGWP